MFSDPQISLFPMFPLYPMIGDFVGVSGLDALEVRPEHGNPASMCGAEERPGVPVHLEHGHALGLDTLGEADGGQRRPGESKGRQAE